MGAQLLMESEAKDLIKKKKLVQSSIGTNREGLVNNTPVTVVLPHKTSSLVLSLSPLLSILHEQNGTFINFTFTLVTGDPPKLFVSYI